MLAHRNAGFWSEWTGNARRRGWHRNKCRPAHLKGDGARELAGLRMTGVWTAGKNPETNVGNKRHQKRKRVFWNEGDRT